MKTGLTPAESMVVNGGERSNAALAGNFLFLRGVAEHKKV